MIVGPDSDRDGVRLFPDTLLDVKSALLQEIQPLVPRLQSGGAKSEAMAQDRKVAVLSVTRYRPDQTLIKLAAGVAPSHV
ncbi:hypothetical protein AK812_SmicGene43340 [Symbiodinium microadriaticum]|uniref:Uncharacterized protein n=1 Tax=Symbiodinium microadriaticum TaxID=2951 RepID=A0A1Q9C195_SYMMI|nr:hypothetical protein AK812_SmicGene43340 [Symbiodinium microadriaticum]